MKAKEKIKSYFQPPTLYRYRPLKNLEREVKAICEATLYCAPYNTMNDPMEGFYTTSQRQRLNSTHAKIRALIADGKSNLGICSFSEVHNNEIMWAHYADEFRGICIAYRFKGLLSGTNEQTEFVRINYRDKAPWLQSDNTEVAARIFLSCKSYRWNYEREWRMLSAPGLSSYKNAKCVRCVYLGSRIDEGQKATIKNLLGQVAIKTHSMSLDGYSMEFNQYE